MTRISGPQHHRLRIQRRRGYFRPPLQISLTQILRRIYLLMAPRWRHSGVRPMEADILQVAKDAQVNHPVPDLQTLKANVPLNTARLAFKTGQYQESIAQALDVLSIKSKFAPAYWGMGISYGMLGQWDQAVSNLQSALKIDKKYKDAKTALKWAKDGQKAATKGRDSKDKPPVWN